MEKMWSSVIVCFSIFAALISSVSSLRCYRCHSSQPGCGLETNIRLQRLFGCPPLPDGAGENFCVKIIEKKGSEQFYTRECLHTLMDHTGHRERMPTVRRHGYCTPARNDDPFHPNNENMLYCFCNDYNGCNTASSLRLSTLWPTLLAVSVVGLYRRFL